MRGKKADKGAKSQVNWDSRCKTLKWADGLPADGIPFCMTVMGEPQTGTAPGAVPGLLLAAVLPSHVFLIFLTWYDWTKKKILTAISNPGY